MSTTLTIICVIIYVLLDAYVFEKIDDKVRNKKKKD